MVPSESFSSNNSDAKQKAEASSNSDFFTSLKRGATEFSNDLSKALVVASSSIYNDLPINTESRDNTYESLYKLSGTDDKPVDHALLTVEQARVETLDILTNKRFNTAKMGILKRQFWANELVNRLKATGIPLKKQHIMIAAVIIDRESGFNEARIVPNPEELINQKIKKFENEHVLIYKMGFDDIERGRIEALNFVARRRQANLENGLYRTTTDGKQIGLFTENDLDKAVDFAIGMYDARATDLLKKFYAKEDLNRFRPKKRGCMGINVQTAIAMAKKYENKNYSVEQMRAILYDKRLSLKYGLLYLKDILKIHENKGGLTSNQVRFVFVDYNLGAYSTRNAAIQKNMQILGQNVRVDAKLLDYDDSGAVLSATSDTEGAIRTLLSSNGQSFSSDEIRRDLLKAKTASFAQTRTFSAMKAIFLKNNLLDEGYIPEAKAKNGNLKSITPKISALQFADGSYQRYEEGNMSYVSKEGVGKTLIESAIDGSLNGRRLRIDLNDAASALHELLYQYHELERLHPEVIVRITMQHPAFILAINRIGNSLKRVEATNGEFSGQDLKKMIDNYNNLAHFINRSVKRLGLEEKENLAMATVNVRFNEVEIDEKALTPKEKAQVSQFAKDVYKGLFPQSYTDKFVNWQMGGVGDLSPELRLAAAPMNGIESAVIGIGNLISSPIETIKGAGQGVWKVGELLFSEKDRQALVKTGALLWNNTSAIDKISPAVSFLAGLAMMGGGFSKMGKLAKSLGYSQSIVYLVGGSSRLFGNVASLGKPLMLGAMTGVVLPYLGKNV